MPFYRKPQAKWDRRHLITISTHLTREQHRRLKRCCARQHVTVYRLVREFLLAFIAEWDGAEDQAQE
ncbi:MAG: hypothetical protein IJL08_03640 [Oscillospiraceae bacterium]|nr:hypothetical protein [Oscillospiraceae bacterium]